MAKLGPAKLLALVGGIALLLGMAYFLSLAMSRGWITNEMRVVLGLVIGFGLLPVVLLCHTIGKSGRQQNRVIRPKVDALLPST